MNYEHLTDQEIIQGLLRNDGVVIEYFFCKKCSKLLSYIVYSIYGGNIDLNELVNELYLYLSTSDWNKVRQFDYRSKLMTWVGVVAIRFFQKKRKSMIDFLPVETQIKKTTSISSYNMTVDKAIDIKEAIQRIPNQRYRHVIQKLDMEDIAPENLAHEMGVSVDNLYNIHRRAILQLKLQMGRKEDYV